MTGDNTRQTGSLTGTACRISVISFNMAHGQGMDGTVDLRRTADVIRNSGADVIGLQEVDGIFSARSGFQDQAAILAGLLGMGYSYGPNLIAPPARPGDPARQYSNAVISRFPIKFSMNHRYKAAVQPFHSAHLLWMRP